MSRAFIKETDVPKTIVGEFRVHLTRSRFDFDLEIEFDSNDLLEVLRFALIRRGYWQIRDTTGALLLEVR